MILKDHSVATLSTPYRLPPRHELSLRSLHDRFRYQRRLELLTTLPNMPEVTSVAFVNNAKGDTSSLYQSFTSDAGAGN